jgi:hypothetical protein
MTTEEQYDNPTDKRLRREKFLSIKYQLDWIKSLKDQVNWANNPEVLPDFVLYLGIRRRFEK